MYTRSAMKSPAVLMHLPQGHSFAKWQLMGMFGEDFPEDCLKYARRAMKGPLQMFVAVSSLKLPC